jgi:hypothetical protein
MSSHAVSQEQPGSAMSRRLRYDRPARPRWCPNVAAVVMVAATTVMLTILLLRPGSPPDGAGWGGTEARAGTPLESFGVPSAGHPPLALTGPRGIVIAASLHDGRQRFGQIVEPGTSGLSGGGHGLGAGLPAVVPPPAHLVAHGHFAVRAPPVARA